MSKVKEMLIEAINDKKGILLEAYENNKDKIPFNYAEGYEDACDIILELVEGILP